MSGSELLSKQRRYNIGEYKNLNRLTANTVTLDYLKFGMDTSNVTITYPEDLINDGYSLVLPNRPGISGEFLGIDDNNKLKFSTIELKKFDRILNYMKGTEFSELKLLEIRRNFTNWFDEYDRRRKLNRYDYFPEMKGFFELCKKI